MDRRRNARLSPAWGAAVLHLLAMAATLALAAWILAGLAGALIAAATAGVMLFVLPRLPVRRAMRLLGGTPLSPYTAPGLYRLVGSLARRAGLPAVPALYRVRTAMPNAAAVGDAGDGGLAVTDGLLELLGPRELAAVLAHEIAHLASGDSELMRLTEALGRVTHAVTSTGIALAVVLLLTVPEAPISLLGLAILVAAPTVVHVIGLALSRGRELAADESAVALTGDPLALAAALMQIERASRWTLRRLFGELSGVRLPAPLSSHPATAERVRRLQALTPGHDPGHLAAA